VALPPNPRIRGGFGLLVSGRALRNLPCAAADKPVLRFKDSLVVNKTPTSFFEMQFRSAPGHPHFPVPPWEVPPVGPFRTFLIRGTGGGYATATARTTETARTARHPHKRSSFQP
jgi:hypothetical protein